MMQHTRQGPTWWHAWLPLLLLGGLLVLEHHAPLSPGGHQIVQLAVTLLMYGVLVYWLRHNRGAIIHEAYEREQAESVYKIMQAQHASVMSDDEPWDAGFPWKDNGHAIDLQRRR